MSKLNKNHWDSYEDTEKFWDKYEKEIKNSKGESRNGLRQPVVKNNSTIIEYINARWFLFIAFGLITLLVFSYEYLLLDSLWKSLVVSFGVGFLLLNIAALLLNKFK